jgi:hypothetical protein
MAMYESLRPLDKANDLPRLPAAETMWPTANPIGLSIAPIEAPRMMERFPIAWRRDGGSWDLVALTGLSPEQETWKPALGDSGERVMPLLLRAYPLTIRDAGVGETLQVLVDQEALLTPWHPDVRNFDPERGEAALTLRLQALWTYAHSRRALLPAFADIEAAGGFTPWELAFKNERHSIVLDGFFVLDRAFLGGPAHRAVIERHGWLAASLISLHRVSQHRINALLHDLDRRSDAA